MRTKTRSPSRPTIQRSRYVCASSSPCTRRRCSTWLRQSMSGRAASPSPSPAASRHPLPQAGEGLSLEILRPAKRGEGGAKRRMRGSNEGRLTTYNRRRSCCAGIWHSLVLDRTPQNPIQRPVVYSVSMREIELCRFRCRWPWRIFFIQILCRFQRDVRCEIGGRVEDRPQRTPEVIELRKGIETKNLLHRGDDIGGVRKAMHDA